MLVDNIKAYKANYGIDKNKTINKNQIFNPTQLFNNSCGISEGIPLIRNAF
jgi:hypothetical protein